MKLTREEILAKLQTILVQQLALSSPKLVDEDATFAELGADSLDHVEIIMAFEEEFDIDIIDDAAEKIKTVAQAIDYLHNNQPA